MKKLIKLSDTHYVIIDDSEKIMEGDIFLHPDKTIERASRNLDGKGLYKITHSTKSFLKTIQLNISYIEKLICNYDVDKLAAIHFDKSYTNYKVRQQGFKEGFKAHQELVEDSMIINDSQMMDIMDICVANRGLFRGEILDKIKEYLSPKVERVVEINEDGSINLI